ncbi:MAG: peptide chain release factor N(5)-glutamine methyltransferase [Sporolactobacillus sp.]
MVTRCFDLLKWAANELHAHNRDENIGEILLEARLRRSRTALLANLNDAVSEADTAWVAARVNEHIRTGKPVQYMLEEAPFYGRLFHVTADVLIPRQETEELVFRAGQWAAKYVGEQTSLRVCDIGTGSGAIAVTLALEHPNWQMTAVDVSWHALKVAEQNAARLGAAVTFRQGNFLEPLDGEKINMIVANPPYITREEMAELTDTVREFEPHLALYGGMDGLDPYREILAQLPPVIDSSQPFLIAFEIGASQGSAVAQLIRDSFAERVTALEIAQDIAGLDRNVMAVLD